MTAPLSPVEEDAELIERVLANLKDYYSDAAEEDFRQAIRAALQALPRYGEEDARDAKRWRALTGCARVRIMGHAGLDADGNPRAECEGRVHVGIEFWTHHEARSEPMAIKVLTTFADAARAALNNGEEE